MALRTVFTTTRTDRGRTYHRQVPRGPCIRIVLVFPPEAENAQTFPARTNFRLKYHQNWNWESRCRGDGHSTFLCTKNLTTAQ